VFSMKAMLVIVGIAATLMITHARAQSSQSTPAFDIASIKPVPPPIPTVGGAWIVTHGRFRAEIGLVRGIVGYAYDVMGAQVKGGPDWLDREPYFVDARSEDSAAGPDQVRLMLQTLLADRFKMTVHRETQQGQVYKLVVGKNGSKLKDVKEGRKNLIEWSGPGQVTFTENSTLLGLINILSNMLGSPILDETGLVGSHTFSLEFTDPRDLRPRQADSRPDLLDAIQEQLGLQLQATKGSVEVLVIDHIERPSTN
jgi:uncharacterized protein (TIGR03435 family)